MIDLFATPVYEDPVQRQLRLELEAAIRKNTEQQALWFWATPCAQRCGHSGHRDHAEQSSIFPKRTKRERTKRDWLPKATIK